MHPNLTPVVSSNIAGYAYDAAKEKLVIAFLKGTHYLYEHVPSEVVRGFEKALSKGEYFSAFIRDKFITSQLDDEGVRIHLDLGGLGAPAAKLVKTRRKKRASPQLVQRYPFLRAAF